MTLQLEATRSAAGGALPLLWDYSLADPWFLLLAPVAVLLFVHGRTRAGRAVGRVSVLPAHLGARSWRQRLAFLPGACQVAALLLAVVALSRPLRGNVRREVISEGVDIVLVIDRSGSMQYDDLERGRSRLDVVKEVVGEFAVRRMTEAEGSSDKVALVTFARYPQLLCPFTLDADALLSFLEGVELVEYRDEDGTAIGMALAKAVALLRDTDAKSKVAVLLTDGENNVPDIRPVEAGELAAEEGIRVHTIYAARNLFVYSPTGGYVATRGGHDTTDLRRIAELTGGRYFEAKDRKGLEDIYAEIEKLERTERRELRYEETFDLYPRFLALAFLLYGLAWLSAATWARTLP